MQTADNWATDVNQCMVPGYGEPQLYTYNGLSQLAPTSYPVTYDQKRACDQVIVTTDLVDQANPAYVYARMYIWKDYTDMLLVTVSINATGFGPGAGPTSIGNAGQYLLAEPSLYNPGFPSGSVSVWGSFLANSPPNYDTSNMLMANVFGQWSCFTFRINLKLTCNPLTSHYSKISASPGGCIYTTTGLPSSDTADLSSSQNLFFSANFNFTRFYLDAATPPGLSGPGYCGAYGGASVTIFIQQAYCICIPVFNWMNIISNLMN